MKTKEDYKNEFWNQIISDISYNYYDDFGEDYEEQIDELAETFANRRMKEQEENNKELTKYKRAFNILENCGLQINENGDLEIDNADFKVVFEDSERLWEIDVELFKELIGNDR